jgi:glycosyltransferase involved in cell wall biosynthesis
MGYRVICFAPRDSYSHDLTELGCHFVDVSINNNGKNPIEDLKLTLSLYKLYKLHKPIAVFHFTIKLNIYGTLAASLCKIPAVNNISGLGTAFLEEGFLNWIVKLLYKVTQNFAFKIFCQNQDDFNLLLEEKLVPANKLFLLPGSGVDLKRFHPDLRDVSANQYFTFLYVGRMLADKGLYELVSAISSINSNKLTCNLVLCGFEDNANQSNISSTQLEEWGELCGIDWIGPSNSVEMVMSKADAVVLPSYREGMPKTILEAFAMSIPVVATNVAGCSNIVDDGVNGILCEPRDTKSLESKLLKMMQLSPQKRMSMGLSGRKKVIKYYDENIVVNILENTIIEIKAANFINN